MKLTLKPNAKTIINNTNDINYRYLSLPYELEINGKSEEVNFMVFSSIPFTEDIIKFLENDSFRIMLIDDGTDIEFEKINSKYQVTSTSDRTNKEVVLREDIVNFVNSYWKDISNLLGEELVNKVKSEIQ